MPVEREGGDHSFKSRPTGGVEGLSLHQVGRLSPSARVFYFFGGGGGGAFRGLPPLPGIDPGGGVVIWIVLVEP